MRIFVRPLVLFATVAASFVTSAGCSSATTTQAGSGVGGGGNPSIGEACTPAMVPATVHLKVSGFSTCSCFNGTFALMKESGASDPNGTTWSSQPITGCPGQRDTAYIKFSIAANAFGVGITDQGSDPGSGNSDFSPATGGTCSPLDVSGGRSTAGNINAFCPGIEDEQMAWTVTD